MMYDRNSSRICPLFALNPLFSRMRFHRRIRRGWMARMLRDNKIYSKAYMVRDNGETLWIIL